MRCVGGEPKGSACLLLLLRNSSVAHNLEEFIVECLSGFIQERQTVMGRRI